MWTDLATTERGASVLFWDMIILLTDTIKRFLSWKFYYPGGSMTCGEFILGCIMLGLILKFIHWLAGVNNGML